MPAISFGHGNAMRVQACGVAGFATLALLFFAGCSRQSNPAAGPVLPPAPVKVVKVEPRDLPLYREFVGQTRGRQDVDVRARVQGYLKTINFKQGSEIKAGDLLFTLDKRPYEAALAQAKAAEAQLRSQYQQAQNDATRYAQLMKTGVIAKQQAEQAQSQASASGAAVAAQHAVVKAKEVDLTFTDIRAPISGRISLTPYSVGDLVGTAGSTEKPLANISQLDWIRVRFAISETDYLRYLKDNPQAASTNGRGQATQALQLTLADGSVYPHPGSVVTADNAIDPATGTLTVEAEFPNPEGVLRTGQYAKVRVSSRVLHDAMAVPARAVQDQQGISSVFVVTEGDRVESRQVQIGDRTSDLWAITSGLEPGARVIVEGLTKAAPGAIVKPEEIPLEAVAGKVQAAVATPGPGIAPAAQTPQPKQ
jgi:membrane fusion protein (multidrug efflux system)